MYKPDSPGHKVPLFALCLRFLLFSEELKESTYGVVIRISQWQDGYDGKDS